MTLKSFVNKRKQLYFFIWYLSHADIENTVCTMNVLNQTTKEDICWHNAGCGLLGLLFWQLV